MSALLIEMGWKSVLVLAAGLAISSLMRGRPAAERCEVLRGAILCLPLLPLIAALPSVQIEAPWLAAPQLEDVLTSAAPAPMVGFDWSLAAATIYALGLAVLLLRTSRGIAQLWRWVGRAAPIRTPAWTSALAASGCNVRLLLSDDVAAPLSFGWRRPVILIDRRAFAQPEHAVAIIAHEAAHIARRDWIVLIALHVVAALFWFNPLVWIAKHAAERCAEEAADALAVQRVDAPDYAQALLDCARGARVATAVAMAHRHVLPRRLKLVLAGARSRERALWSSMLSGAATVCFSISVATVYVATPVTVASAARVQATLSPPLPVTSVPQNEHVMPSAASSRRIAQQPVAGESMPRAIVESSDALMGANEFALTPTPTGATNEAPPQSTEHMFDDPRRARWSENARRNLERNERRMAQRARRDRARANSNWVHMETSSN